MTPFHRSCPRCGRTYRWWRTACGCLGIASTWLHPEPRWLHPLERLGRFVRGER